MLSKLSAFRSKLKSTFLDEDDVEPAPGGDGVEADEDHAKEANGADTEEAAMEIDVDTGFLSHKLYFPKDNEEVEKAEREYEVIDPRQRSARAREEEKERKKRMRPKDGGRGYRR